MLSVNYLYKESWTVIDTRLLSTIDDAASLTEFLLYLFERLGIKKHEYFKISLCVGEAINNIIEHGYESNHRKPIRCIFYITKSDIRTEIIDAAKAYTPPDNQSIDLKEENGRGWYILRNWSHSIMHQRKGRINRLTLKFNLKPELLSQQQLKNIVINF